MFTIKNIPLAGHIPEGKHIRFLSVDVDPDLMQPLACVRYSLNGADQKLDLRLDLDKRISLDTLDNSDHQAEVTQSVADLCAFLTSRKAKKLIASAKPIIIGAHVRLSPPPLPTSRSVGAHSD